MLTHTVCRVLACVEQTVSPPDKLINDLCSLDTGRLNPETYRLFETVEKHYGIRIEYTFPDAQETMDLVREKGMFSFYEDGHQECCRVRKVLCICPSSLPHAPCFAAKQCCRMQAGTSLWCACLLGLTGNAL